MVKQWKVWENGYMLDYLVTAKMYKKYVKANQVLLHKTFLVKFCCYSSDYTSFNTTSFNTDLCSI